MKFKKSFIINLFLLFILPYTILTEKSISQEWDRQKFIDAIIEEIKLNKGRTMGHSPTKILHIYSVEIPEDAEILHREKNYNYEICPVYITYVHRASNYKIVKQRVPFDVIVFLNPKDSYASMNKQSDRIAKFETTTYWQYEESTNEFKKTLDGMKNLSNTSFEELYGAEDNFPSKWKK